MIALITFPGPEPHGVQTMYIPDPFRIDDPAQIASLVDAYPFATLVSHTLPPQIAHVPVLPAEGDAGVFEGHLARANPMAGELRDGARFTAAFLGPHDYVSPTWYVTPGLVPTWNFAAVHVTGTVRRVSDHGPLSALVERIADRFERNRDDPWVPDYAESMLDAIVGFTLHAERVEAKFKFSQNRGAADREAVTTALAAGGNDARTLARWMRRYAPVSG